MKIYFKQYGWMRVRLSQWLRALAICSWRGQRWKDNGDPCWCGSDNCAICLGCTYQVHD